MFVGDTINISDMYPEKLGDIIMSMIQAHYWSINGTTQMNRELWAATLNNLRNDLNEK